MVKQSHQPSDAADGLLRGAEAALHALRNTMRQAPTLSATSETKHQGKQIRLLSYNVLPMHLQVGDRFSDETGEWEIASRSYSRLCWRPHTDALVSDPRPILHSGGLVNSPDASANILATCGRTLSA